MNSSSKSDLRAHFKWIRKNISIERRKHAEHRLKNLLLLTQHSNFVLSYASFKDELCTLMLNKHLEKQGKLLLPKISRSSLKIFHITDLAKQTRNNSWGIPEPIPSFCREVTQHLIDIIFVPGLAFDHANHRLGYGKGCYDSFLSTFTKKILSIGIGFTEQFSQKNLPIESTDVPLSKIYLF